MLTFQCFLHRHTSPISYAEPGKSLSQHEGTADDAIRRMVLYGETQATAARTADCCPMMLSRAIKGLKEAGMWEEHAADVLAAAVPVSPSKATKGSATIDMPTPASLAAQIKAGTDRLGDGRPYGNSGHSWGEYREGWKIATSAIAKAGPVTRANAEAASAKLAAVVFTSGYVSCMYRACILRCAAVGYS